MPDRLPSLILLAGFWIPPAAAGFVAAELTRARPHAAARVAIVALAGIVVTWAACWFVMNLYAMPPYVPGATLDPTVAAPEAVRGLAIRAGALVLPGSAIACAVAYRRPRALDAARGHTAT